MTSDPAAARPAAGHALIPWLAAGLVLFGALLAVYGTAPADYLKFLAGLVFLAYLPGRALLRMLRCLDPDLMSTVLSLAAGINYQLCCDSTENLSTKS